MKEQEPLFSPQSFVCAQNLGLRSLQGFAYEDVSLTIPQGGLSVICGDHGCGKTSLLLTIVGRMLPTHGSLQVMGYTSPKERKKIARISDLGIFEGLNEPDKNIRVLSIMRADLDLGNKKHSKEAALQYLSEWNLSECAQKKVRDITQQQRVLFGVALAACSSPKLIVIDDLENQLTIKQSLELMEKLKDFSHKTNITIVAGITEESIASAADTVHYLGRH